MRGTPRKDIVRGKQPVWWRSCKDSEINCYRRLGVPDITLKCISAAVTRKRSANRSAAENTEVMARTATDSLSPVFLLLLLVTACLRECIYS